jgi:ABC-2 type transport system permease protein
VVARIRRNATIIGALALRDLQVAWTYRTGFLLGQVSPLLMIELFYFVSRVVGEGSIVGSPDEYFQFVVIGIAVSSVIDGSASSAAESARKAQVEGSLEALAVQPISPMALALGWSLYPVLDSIIRALITVALAIPFGLATGVDPNWPGIAVVLAISAIAFVGVGMIGSALIVAFQQGVSLVDLAMAALAVFSGALFPVEVLPGWMQPLTELSPLTHALDAMRAVALDGASIGSIANDLVVLTGFAIALVPIGGILIHVAMRHARRVGGLGKL